MGAETENYEIAAKRFESTVRAMGFGIFGDFRSSRSKSTGGALKASTNLSHCEAELHRWEIPTPCSMLSHMGSYQHNEKTHARCRNAQDSAW